MGGKPRYQQRTYKTGLGKVQGKHGWNPLYPKTPVFAAVERGGRVRARVMPTVNARNVKRVLREIVSTDAHLRTDESSIYTALGKPFAGRALCLC